MNKSRVLILLVVLIFTTSFFTISFFTSTEDGEYTEEQVEGSYSSGDLVEIIDVLDGVVSLTIDGEKVLMKESESYTIEDSKSEYSGTVEIIKVEDDKVVYDVSVEKTSYFYKKNIFLVVFLSAIFTLVMSMTLSQILDDK